MGLLGKLFGKKTESSLRIPKGFVLTTVEKIQRETPLSVSIQFRIPEEHKSRFNFIPGQYITVLATVNGKEERRSYSLCSSPEEGIRIGVKEVEDGIVSTFLNRQLAEGQEIMISFPEGNFRLKEKTGNYVAFAAGSGITPILSIAKTLAGAGGKLNLFYGNRTQETIMFRSELEQLSPAVQVKHILSGEELEGFGTGRLNKDKISEIIKQDLAMLRADGFFICGPEEMIVSAIETLKLFGVQEDKIIYELFTTPVLMKSNEKKVVAEQFEGVSHVEVEMDGEMITFDLATKGKSILDHLTDMGEDAPYSCKGGVCCTCRAKVTEGLVVMDLNYSLTDKEVEEGYVLTCQAHPASETLKLTYDE